MTEAAKAARRAYKREWNRRNREKVREDQKAYWEKRAQEAELAAANEEKLSEVN